MGAAAGAVEAGAAPKELPADACCSAGAVNRIRLTGRPSFSHSWQTPSALADTNSWPVTTKSFLHTEQQRMPQYEVGSGWMPDLMVIWQVLQKPCLIALRPRKSLLL
jgi:hypothetical protein